MTEPVPTPDAPVEPVVQTPHRLHPMSWLFVLLAQLRQFVVPLLVLFFLGRRDRGAERASDWQRWDSELWPLVGVAVLAVAAVWRYFTYSYGMGEDALIIRSGVLSRTQRIIPFARIHNVALEQSLLHRLFGVASVRLESAGSESRPEAEMRVLSLDAAIALEALVRRRAAPTVESVATSPSPDGPPPPSQEPARTGATSHAPTILLALPLREVVLQGLLSNRGLIAVGALVAALSQPASGLDVQFLWKLAARWIRPHLGATTDGLSRGAPLELAVYGALLFALALAAVRLLSVALTLLRDHGFTLSLQGRRLTVERGLLSRVRTSISRRRIQAWTLSEPLLHRLVGRRSLSIDNASRAAEQEAQHTLRELAPIATPEVADQLIHAIAPGVGWSALPWQPLPRSHWWRRFLPALLPVLLLTAALSWFFGEKGLLPLLWLPFAALVARREAEHARWAVTDQVVAVREGWIRRTWRFAELDRLQAVEITRSPIDHRLATATLWLDTAGAGGLGPPLRIAYLPEAEAERLASAVTASLARRPLSW